MTFNHDNILSMLEYKREEAFKMLVPRYGEALYWHIRRLVVSHADAQDVVQEVWIRVYRSIGSLDRQASLEAWLYKIATNEALRQLDRKPLTVEPLVSGMDVEVDEYIDYSDLEAVKLQRAILTLPQKQQLVFNLRYYDDMDYERIAEIMSSTVDRVKANYYLAKKKIISYITDKD